MKILMCHDGSELTDKALRIGATVAKACKAEVTLLGINESGGVDPSVLLAHLQSTRAALEKEGIRAELVSKSGAPVAEILSQEEKETYELVIIGAGLPGTEMPAKTYELVRRIGPTTLLAVGEHATLARMLICTSGNFYIENAIIEAGRIAVGTGASVTLLHVMAQAPLLYANMMTREENVDSVLAEQSQLGISLSRQKKMLESLGIPVEVRLRHGEIAEEVIKEVEESGIDLIVAGCSIDHGPLYRYMLGDVTRQIVNRAPCSVWISRQLQVAGTGLLRRWVDRIIGRGHPQE